MIHCERKEGDRSFMAPSLPMRVDQAEGIDSGVAADVDVDT